MGVSKGSGEGRVLGEWSGGCPLIGVAVVLTCMFQVCLVYVFRDLWLHYVQL